MVEAVVANKVVVVALVVVELVTIIPVATFGCRDTPSEDVAHLD